MESLAYLHLTASVEANLYLPASSTSIVRRMVHVTSNDWNGKQLSAGLLLRLLAVCANLLVLAIATQATAEVLESGDVGPEVEALQRCLIDQGYLTTSTFQNFGSKTEAAVKEFQRDQGLAVDGIVGSETAAALGCNLTGSVTPAISYYPPASSYYEPPPPYNPRYSNASQTSIYAAQTRPLLRLNSNNSTAVKELQKLLKRRGFYTGEIDGVFGLGTENAVQRFQQLNSLDPDGVVGSATWTALGVNNGGDDRDRIADKYGVVALQRQLQEQGFYKGLIDGDMGPATKQAIAAAQRAYGVSDSEILTGRLPR